jgi:hypothetical protein
MEVPCLVEAHAEQIVVVEAVNVTACPVEFEYKEPVEYNIIKREWFDEENIKHLLNDNRFNKQDRTHLSHYNKHRTSGSQINTQYCFGLGCEEAKLGRLFPVDALGLQSFRFDIRNPLARKWYWDTDIANAHFLIALKWARDYELKHDCILEYITHREEKLKLVSPNNRKKAKTEFLKCLYLGDIKLFSQLYNEVEGDITEEGFVFLTKLKKEVETLALTIWEKFPALHKLKTGKDKKMLKSKPNPKASLMSLLFQTEERKMLMVWDAFLTFKGRYLSVYIHDGGYVKKLEGETHFPPELLVEGAIQIKKYTGYDVKLETKDIAFDWKPQKPDNDVYNRLKTSFEKHSFLLSHQVVTQLSNGKLEYLKLNEAKIKYAPLKFSEWCDDRERMVEVKFIDRWIEDPERLFYENVGFYPETSLCPPKTYNLFRGFNAERFRPDVPLTKERIRELVAPILYHYDLLTSGHAYFILKWFANIIQFPHIKPDLAILNRDESKLLAEGGGTGKNLGYEYFGNEILGEEYTIVVGDNDILYGNFNSHFENKLLVFVEEADGASNFKAQDKLKSKITGKKINVNKKNVAQYDLDDFARYLFATNNRNPLPIRMGDRRWGVFDVNPEKRGDVEYFEKLVEHLAKDEVKWAFYQYLKTLDTFSSSVKWARSVPITPAYREIRQLNAPLHLKWITSCLESGDLPNMWSVGDLYKRFRDWASETKQKGVGEIITPTAFGLLLVQEPDVDADYQLSNEQFGNKKRTSAGMIMNWNYDGLIDGLKKLHLLEPDFVYTAGGCLINTFTPDEDCD